MIPWRCKSLIGLLEQCGLQKPQCAQCLKSNRICAGYQRERIFILDPSILNQDQAAALRLDPINDYSLASQATSEIVPFRFGKERVRTKQKRSTALQSQPNFGMDIDPSTSYRQQLLKAYVDYYVCPEQFEAFGEKPWIRMLPELASPSRALEVSSMALCTAKLGRVHNDIRLVKESFKLYTDGLRELQLALWDSELMYRDDTLAACMALAMYELVECPAKSKYGFVSHCNGCGRLIQLRGPEAHTSGLGHQVFLVYRIQGVRCPLPRARA